MNQEEVLALYLTSESKPTLQVGTIVEYHHPRDKHWGCLENFKQYLWKHYYFDLVLGIEEDQAVCQYKITYVLKKE